MSYDIQSDIRYELIQLLTHDSYNKSIAEYYQDEGDIYSSLDNMETEFDEIVCRLSISHPDKIARAASRLGSARCEQIIRESGRIMHKIPCLVWLGWDQLIECDNKGDLAENP